MNKLKKILLITFFLTSNVSLFIFSGVKSTVHADSCGGVTFGNLGVSTVESAVYESPPGTINITITVSYPDVDVLGNALFNVEIFEDGNFVSSSSLSAIFANPSGGRYTGTDTVQVSLPPGNYEIVITEQLPNRFTDGTSCRDQISLDISNSCSVSTVCQLGIGAGCEEDEYCVLDGVNYDCRHKSLVANYCSFTCGDADTNCMLGTLGGCNDGEACVGTACLDMSRDSDEIAAACTPDPNDCVPQGQNCTPSNLLDACCQDQNSSSPFECIIDPTYINSGYDVYFCGDPTLVVAPPAFLMAIFCDESGEPTHIGTDGSGNPRRIHTAIGCIQVAETTQFSEFMLTFGFGIGGGIALVMIGIAGFLIQTSAGDPQRLQAGKELLMAAIAGLILMIFSIFILRLIGVEILGIPELSNTA